MSGHYILIRDFTLRTTKILNKNISYISRDDRNKKIEITFLFENEEVKYTFNCLNWLEVFSVITQNHLNGNSTLAIEDEHVDIVKISTIDKTVMERINSYSKV